MATGFGFQADKNKKMAAGGLPQFGPPQRAPWMLGNQVNPTNAALVTNGRSPVDQPGPVSPSPANTAANLTLPRDPSTMIQGPDGVTAPGQKYPGRSLVPTSAPFPTSDARGLVPVDAGRGFSPPSGGSYDPNTIRQGTNTSAPSNMATTGGRALALTGDAGRATTSIGKPANASFAAGASPEAMGYQAARTGPTQTGAPTPAASPAVGWKGMAGSIAKNIGLGAVGFGAARLMDNMSSNEPGTNVDTRTNVNAIPIGGNAPAPEAGPARGWWDTETGRNVSNTLNAVTPMLGPVAGVFRAGSTASKIANVGAAVAGGMAAGAAPTPPLNAEAPGLDAASPQPNAAAPASSSITPAAPVPVANPNQITAARQPNGVMSFSGSPNIGKDGGAISYTGPAGFKPSGAGVTVVPGASISGGSPSNGEVLAAARMAAADRGDFGAVRDSYFAQGQGFGGQTRDSVATDRLKEIALSPVGTPGRKAALQMYGEQTAATTARQGQDAANKLAQQKLGMEQIAQGFQTRAAKRIEDLQASYEAAKPEDRSAIAEQLRVLTGKDKPAEWKAIALQGSTDAMGNKTEGVLAAVNERTGESKRLDGATPQAKTQFKVGQVHQDASGNRATWDGTKWTPVK